MLKIRDLVGTIGSEYSFLAITHTSSMNNIQPILNELNQRNFELLEGQDITPLFEHLTININHVFF